MSAKIEEVEARFRVMADSAPVLLWMAEPNSECSFFNQRWLEFSGRTMEEELGNGWAEAVHFEDFQRCMHTYLNAFVEKKPFSMEYRLRRADGVFRWIYDQGTPRFAPDGAFAGYIGSCVDITEHRAAQTERENMIRELDERVRERTRELKTRLDEREVLLREVHHRVKNNLQLIASLLNLQARSSAEPRIETILEECKSRVETIALVHQSLYELGDWSRIPFSHYARQLAQNVFRGAAVSSAIQLEVDVAEITVPVSVAIPCGLILNELITNAIKHAFPDGRGGVVTVRLKSGEQGRVTMSVIDDGIGLPAALQVNDVPSLGFQLVTTLTEQLHGVLTIERAAGTAFHVGFPAPR